jgi:hypothetical protein
MTPQGDKLVSGQVGLTVPFVTARSNLLIVLEVAAAARPVDRAPAAYAARKCRLFRLPVTAAAGCPKSQLEDQRGSRHPCRFGPDPLQRWAADRAGRYAASCPFSASAMEWKGGFSSALVQAFAST